MVSAVRVDALQNPTSALLELFSEHDGASASGNFPGLVSEHFASIFRTLEAFEEVCKCSDNLLYGFLMCNARSLHWMFAIPPTPFATEPSFASGQWYRTRRLPQRCTSPSSALESVEDGASKRA